LIIRISKRQTTSYADGSEEKTTVSMGSVFGAINLFEDPFGRKRRYGGMTLPVETGIYAEISEGANLISLTIHDFAEHVLDNTYAKRDIIFDASFNTVEKELKSLLASDLFYVLDNFGLIPEDGSNDDDDDDDEDNEDGGGERIREVP
jgi:hypothetical protein